MIYIKENFTQNNIDLEKLFEKFKGKGNYIQNKKDSSHEALWFGDVGYKYGNYRELSAEKMPEEFKEIAKQIDKELGKTDYFNSCYVNKYHSSGMGYHHDNDLIFKKDKTWNGGKEIVVAVVSFGGEATIDLSQNKKDIVSSVIASNNSLYVMLEDCQNKYFHKVGKSNGTRFSLTFRHTV